MTTEIQSPRPAQQLTDLYGTTGKLAMRLDEVVVPVVQVADVGADAWGHPAMGRISVGAGGAGNRSEAEIALPVTTAGMHQLEILVERIIIHNPAAVSVQIGESPGLPAPTTVGTIEWMDTGLRGAPGAALNGKNDAGASVFAPAMQVRAAADDTLDFPLHYLLRKQDPADVSRGLMIRADTDNTVLQFSVVWRERPPR